MNLLEILKNYIYNTLKVVIDPRPFENQWNLPFYITDSYEFFETNLFGRLCLLMIDKKRYDFLPVIIDRDSKKTKKILECSIVIYVQSTISSYNRKRLIEMNLPFVIPGNQMYLPCFGNDLIDNFMKI